MTDTEQSVCKNCGEPIKLTEPRDRQHRPRVPWKHIGRNRSDEQCYLFAEPIDEKPTTIMWGIATPEGFTPTTDWEELK